MLSVYYPETATPLSGSTTFTGSTRDVGAPSGETASYAYFNGFFFADQTGTATLECSQDGTTWRTCATSSLTASTPLTLTVPIFAHYYRAKLVNGATPQTVLMVNSSFTAA